MALNDIQYEFALARLKDFLAPVVALLEEDDVQEVMINGPDDVWIERAGHGLAKLAISISGAQIAGYIQVLAACNGKDAIGGTVTGIIDARTPGLRIAAVLPPTAVNGPSVSIRKHNSSVFSMDDYVNSGTIPKEVAEVLVKLIKQHKSIIVAGGTSTGKTTLLNALIANIDQTERVITIEDTRELQVKVPNWVPLESNAQEGVTASLLLKLCLRFRPDRILVGEIRDQTAFDLLQAANSGHSGSLATIHANNAADTLTRLETCVLMANTGWPHMAICNAIASAFEYVIHMKREKGVRFLSEVIKITGFDKQTQKYLYETVYNHGN